MRLRSLLACAVLLLSVELSAQDAVKPKTTVLYVAESQSVAAGKKVTLELHFKVVDGYHVNSHTPRSEYLIPTVLKSDATSGVVEGMPVYSAGQEFNFSFSPTEKLDVYSGDFTIKLPVTAEAGEHTVPATLHYQACDHAACYPPKSLPLQVLFTAK